MEWTAMNELVGPKSIKKESATIVDEWRYSGRSTFHFYVFFFCPRVEISNAHFELYWC